MTDYDRLTQHLLARGLASRTVALYLAVARRADLVAAEMGLELATLTPIEARILSESWPGGRSSKTQLRSALQHLWDAQGRLDGPGRAIRVPRHPHYRCRALGERQAALLAAEARRRHDPKGLAVLFGLYGAMRRAEIAKIRRADITEELSPEGTLELWLRVRGKGDFERNFPIHPVLAAALGETRGLGSDWLFPGRFGRGANPATIWSWIREVADSAGLRVAPHELRHTALATAHDATGDLRATMEFAGHQRPETTVVYTRTTERRLRSVVRSIDYGGEPA